MGSERERRSLGVLSGPGIDEVNRMALMLERAIYVIQYYLLDERGDQ